MKEATLHRKQNHCLHLMPTYIRSTFTRIHMQGAKSNSRKLDCQVRHINWCHVTHFASTSMLNHQWSSRKMMRKAIEELRGGSHSGQSFCTLRSSLFSQKHVVRPCCHTVSFNSLKRSSSRCFQPFPWCTPCSPMNYVVHLAKCSTVSSLSPSHGFACYATKKPLQVPRIGLLSLYSPLAPWTYCAPRRSVILT